MSTYDSTLDIYIGYYGGRRPDAEGLFSEFTSTGNANPTGRVLSGSSDHGYAEEWEEPGTFRGAKCVCIFLFSRVARSRLTTTKMQTSPEVLKQARKVLGQYLRAIREHREMTQVQQADASGLAQADVSEIENGSLNYGIDKLLSYCRGVDCCFFLGSRDGKHLDLDHMIEKMRDPI